MPSTMGAGLLGAALALAQAATAGAQSPPVQAIRFERLVDGDGRVTPDAVVVVADGRIQSVGSGDAAVPSAPGWSTCVRWWGSPA